MDTPQNSQKAQLVGWIALALAPMFFSTNIIFGRSAVDINPFTLAALRWSISSVILLMIIRSQWDLAWNIAKNHWKLLSVASFAAMWICGGVVYLALQHTTATNGTLIYTTPPLMIILIQRITSARPIKKREITGIIAAILGITIIISKGQYSLASMSALNPGDAMFLLAAFSWAIYSLLLKSKAFSQVPTLVLFSLIAAFGSILLLPVAAYEIITTAEFPTQIVHWQMIVGIVLFSSLLSFSTYQFGVKIHGAATSSIFMYFMPPFGLGFAWIFLEEVPTYTILIGCIFVIGGVLIATWPKKT